MGNFSYENQGASTYLVYTMSDGEVMDSMSLGMITNNAIPGFAGTVFMQMNAVRYIKYNISSRIPVSQFFSGPVNKKRLLGVFDGIVNGMLAAEEYMIDAGTILMDLNYIYADVSACDAVLICLPVMGAGAQKPDLSRFFKEIMFRTQFDQTENCDHVTKIINYLNSAHIFSLADFKALIWELREGTAGGASGMPGSGAGGVHPGGIGGYGGAPEGGTGGHGGIYPGGGSPVSGGASGGAYPGGGTGAPGGAYPGAGPGGYGGAYPGGGPAAPGGPYPGGSPSVPGGSGGTSPGGAPGAVPGYPAGGPVPIPPVPGGMPGAGPGVQIPPAGQPGSVEEAGSKEKGMSLFYLLRHYDKENAEIYKAQKEERKQQKEAKEPKKKEKPVKEKPSKEKKGKAKKGTGFAIPGQMAPPIPPSAPGVPVPPVMPIPGGNMPGAAPVQPPVQNAVPPIPGGHMPGGISTPPQGPVMGMPAAPTLPGMQSMGSAGADFGNTVILGGGDDDDGATMIMGAGAGFAEPQIHPHLIRRRNNERIPISRELFRLGRNQDFNDYVVLGNDFVGNTHCHILVRGEEYFVVDDNSKNHTFVNGVMVMPGTEVKLMHGQTVTLADEEFEFRLF